MMKKIEDLFEMLVWESRLVVVVAVIASLFAGFAMFFIATVDAFYMLSHLFDYVSPSLAAADRGEFRSETVAHVVEIVDGYLLATFLLIFSFGLYELFVSEIDRAKTSASGSNVLMIHSLDDLKARLAKVVMMILVVKFFEHAIGMHYTSPLDLVYLAGGIALIGLGLYLTHASESSKH